MINIRISVAFILAVGFFTTSPLVMGMSARVGEPAHQVPKSLAEVQVSDCTPQEALGWMSISSIEREGDNAPQGRRQIEQLQALLSSLPSGKEKVPVGQQMTPDQAAKFAQLSAQMLIYQLNHLAESRLQRDSNVMRWAVDAIEKLRAGEDELKSKDDPGGDGAGLVGLLRKASEGNSLQPSQPPDTSVCSLDLALFSREAVAYSAMESLMSSREMVEMNELVAKYKVTGVLDPDKLPSPDREKAVWLQKAVGQPFQRELLAVQDWENLRRFAKVSTLKYSTDRDEIIAGAGAKDYDYDKSFNKVYATADMATKRTIDAWWVIDHNLPCEAVKEDEQNAKMLQESEHETK